MEMKQMYTEKELEMVVRQRTAKAEYHAECLREMAIATTAGSLIGFLMCKATEPIFALFVAFSFIATVLVWKVLDLVDETRAEKKQEKAEAENEVAQIIDISRRLA